MGKKQRLKQRKTFLSQDNEWTPPARLRLRPRRTNITPCRARRCACQACVSTNSHDSCRQHSTRSNIGRQLSKDAMRRDHDKALNWADRTLKKEAGHEGIEHLSALYETNWVLLATLIEAAGAGNVKVKHTSTHNEAMLSAVREENLHQCMDELRRSHVMVEGIDVKDLRNVSVRSQWTPALTGCGHCAPGVFL